MCSSGAQEAPVGSSLRGEPPKQCDEHGSCSDSASAVGLLVVFYGGSLKRYRVAGRAMGTWAASKALARTSLGSAVGLTAAEQGALQVRTGVTSSCREPPKFIYKATLLRVRDTHSDNAWA